MALLLLIHLDPSIGLTPRLWPTGAVAVGVGSTLRQIQMLVACLKQRLADFTGSDCWKVLSHEGVKVQNVLDHYNEENFYDVRPGSQFANLTLSDIGIASSNKTTLNATSGSSDAATVGTLGSASTTAILVGTQYFFPGNSDAIRMNSLLHEMVHALGGFDDAQILNNKYFLQNGLVNKSVGNILDTGGITDWLSRDCNK